MHAILPVDQAGEDIQDWKRQTDEGDRYHQNHQNTQKSEKNAGPGAQAF